MIDENVSVCINGQNCFWKRKVSAVLYAKTVCLDLGKAQGRTFHPALMAFHQVAAISSLTFPGRMPCKLMIQVVYAELRNKLQTV